MKILYASDFAPYLSCAHRMFALQRLGHEVVSFDTMQYESANPWVRKFVFRAVVGPSVDRLNKDLLQLAERERPELLWADKLLRMQPATLKRLRSMGIPMVSYMVDNPFGPRKDPGWRLYMKTIPLYDLHVVQRDKSILDYKSRGALDVIKVQTAYEPTVHFPPPAGWSDKDRDRQVSFIGTPYDQRAEFLTRLWKEFKIPITISGTSKWEQALADDASRAMYSGGGGLYEDKYRAGIWRSKINISFVTHSNQDEFTQKSFEIAACGGFLLAERSQGHLDRFREDEEAVFFSTLEECAEKIRRYLPDEAARSRIALAGQQRAERDGYHNDHQVALIIERAKQIAAGIQMDRKPRAYQ